MDWMLISIKQDFLIAELFKIQGFKKEAKAQLELAKKRKDEYERRIRNRNRISLD